MLAPGSNPQTRWEKISPGHPEDPMPQGATSIPQSLYTMTVNGLSQPLSSPENYNSSSDSETPTTPGTDPHIDGTQDSFEGEISSAVDLTRPRPRRASTISALHYPENGEALGGKGEANTKLLEKVCCGGNCCFLDTLDEDPASKSLLPIVVPDNDAFRTLGLKLGPLSLESKLTKTAEVSFETIAFTNLPTEKYPEPSTVQRHPPKFVTPHFPYEVFSAKVHHARELTKPGAEKRTYHFDLDVTDYPKESGEVDFVVGGAMGICAPNSEELVNEIFDVLGIPSYARDKQVLMKTTSGRWPTIWGDDMPRQLITTRRELLTWCSDVQSYPPTKPLLRLLAEHASAPNEKKILLYLSSAQGQAAFCNLRTGPHITLAQLLHAFPSSKPPLPHLLSVLQTLMPRFYSLSQDPSVSCERQGTNCRRLIEIAVTVHETPNWRGGPRTGVGSGYLERVARKIIAAEENGQNPLDLDVRVPMFRGLMANPLAREFASDGPMLLIGAGVGVAPFRGFVQRRLRAANCANKIWVLQGIRDSLLDELYSGEWGGSESTIKKVVESRVGEGRYVQEEVRRQAELVWEVINSVDGRVFVCGAGKGMGEGVERALVEVVMERAGLSRGEAEGFWKMMAGVGKYIAETW